MISRLTAILAAIAVWAGVATVVALVLAVPMMLAWNGFFPSVMGAPEIDYIQAFSLVVFASLALKSGSAGR